MLRDHRAPIARGKSVASIHSAEPNRSPGSLKPRPLRARPRGSARTRFARHLDSSARVERPLAIVVRAKSQGMGSQELGKGDACCRGQQPTIGLTSNPSSSPWESSLAGSRVARFKPAYTVNLRMRSTLPPTHRRRGRFFLWGVLCEDLWLCPRKSGAKSLWKHKVREPCPSP